MRSCLSFIYLFNFFYLFFHRIFLLWRWILEIVTTQAKSSLNHKTLKFWHYWLVIYLFFGILLDFWLPIITKVRNRKRIFKKVILEYGVAWNEFRVAWNEFWVAWNEFELREMNLSCEVLDSQSHRKYQYKLSVTVRDQSIQ